ncbi:ABC transporter ATP-binding protein [Streptomyces sp. NPDC085946]|uniref:ABC transporter ATP-binding protein n=1 Tax=Streptomyces sp. NPDC085946 TaxID=3365744 RepID=UPI0037D30A13
MTDSADPGLGLQADGLVVDRAGLSILRDVSVSARPGQVSLVVGPNGAGKTTLLEALSGVLPVTGGHVRVAGADVTGWRCVRRAAAGLVHVEQGRSVFRELTTEENLKVAAAKSAPLDEAYELFPELVKRKNVQAGRLSGGEQQMVAVARAWLRRPSVLLLDELSLGLAPVVVVRLLAAVRELADRGASVILVEQFAALALEIADEVSVLREGRVVFSGDAAALRDAPELLQTLYLGSVEERVA